MKPEVEPGKLVNRKALRELLVKSFDYEELKDLCFDHYPAVYDKLGSSFGKNVIARLIIDHCERHGLIEQLVDVVKAHNPYQFSNYEDRLFAASAPTLSSKEQPKVTIKLVFPDVNVEDFTQDKQAALIHLIAEELNIPEESIDIVEIRAGSTIVELSLPASAVRQLLALFFAAHPVIRDLGIGRIERVPLQISIQVRLTRLLTRLSNYFNLNSFLVGIVLVLGLGTALFTIISGQHTTPPANGSSTNPVPEIVFVTPTLIPAAPSPSLTPIAVAATTDLSLNTPPSTATLMPPTGTVSPTVAITTPPVTSPTSPIETPKPTTPVHVTPDSSTPTLPKPSTAPSQTQTPTPAADIGPLATTPLPESVLIGVKGPNQIKPGQRFTATVEIKIDGSPGVFGAQFALDYDPDLLEVVGLQPNPELLVALRTIDNENGRIDLAASRREDVSNFTDDVTFATITFKAEPRVLQTITVVRLKEVKLGAKGGIVVPAASQSLAITIDRDTDP